MLEVFLRRNKGKVRIIDSKKYLDEAKTHRWQVMWPIGNLKYILFEKVQDFIAWRGNNYMAFIFDRSLPCNKNC